MNGQKKTRVVVFTDVPMRTRGEPGQGERRRRVLERLEESRVKVREDGGGRLLVVEATDAEARELEGRLEGARVVDLETGFDELLGELDEQDVLFAKALAIRVSPEYRDLKANQKPGETPEEQLLISGPCTPPED